MDDAMDVVPVAANLVDPGDDLVKFATALSIGDTRQPRAADLRLVLKSHGANEEVAELLNSDNAKFLPLKRKKGLTTYACKDCGKMHDQTRECDAFTRSSWARSLERTGWEAAINAWIRRGWRLNLDRSVLKTSDISRQQSMTADLEVKIEKGIYTKPLDMDEQIFKLPTHTRGKDGELILVTNDGIASVDFSPGYVLPSNAMPVWTTASFHNHLINNRFDGAVKGHEESGFNGAEVQEKLKEIREVRRRERKRKQKAKKASAAEGREVDERRFLRLYNELHEPPEQVNMEGVKKKFKNSPRLLKKAVKRLQEQQCDQLLSQLDNFTVEDSLGSKLLLE